MNESVVTQLWMAGVMAVMAAFGLIAAVGWLRSRRERK